MALMPDPPPRRNPVPRPERRRSIDDATNEEYAHLEHVRKGLSYLSCWYCWHGASEHLDHDWLVEDCPDCRRDGMRA